ncbi:DUF7344 domain-containing protein [Halomarina ordinaria]|uniref:DUF7344 domain-containing protein n=1 Tax=Halomarina ordinaria TaxID=3033939 RepID=A0ABD5U6F9_9EURY|nr:hypothetical protein [Halomarina sp. PSRA2]
MSYRIEPTDATDRPQIDVPENRRLRHDDVTETVSQYFRLLSRTRRRFVLYLLNDAGALPVEDLAVRLARARTDVSTDGDPAEGAVRDEQLTLRHNHLPALAEAGVVEYDASAGTVALSLSSRELSDLLSVAVEFDLQERE